MLMMRRDDDAQPLNSIISMMVHPDAQPLIPGTSFEQLPGSASLIQTFIRTNPAPNLFSSSSDLGTSG